MLKVKIENFRLETLCEGSYIRPYLAVYLQDGEERSWEVLEAGDSVAVLIYHRGHGAFVFVRQFRPAVYMKNGSGMTIELCAGLMTKISLPRKQLLKRLKRSVVMLLLRTPCTG